MVDLKNTWDFFFKCCQAIKSCEAEGLVFISDEQSDASMSSWILSVTKTWLLSSVPGELKLWRYKVIRQISQAMLTFTSIKVQYTLCNDLLEGLQPSGHWTNFTVGLLNSFWNFRADCFEISAVCLVGRTTIPQQVVYFYSVLFIFFIYKSFINLVSVRLMWSFSHEMISLA